ncbi:amidohydrolase family protein [Aliikangiella maris]|uniref:Amidohydrolase family protein n=2 Tax=Aliikangiella maris TaxID=3162458 RepID=A0ABV3MJ46_9GAMM
MIFDCHAHVASNKVLPDRFFDGWVDNIVAAMPGKATDFQIAAIQRMFRELNADHDCSKFVAEMDDAGIDKAILLIIDFGFVYQGEADPIEDIYAIHRDIHKKYPGRFEIFTGVDPRRGREGVDTFEKSVRDWGFKGLKLYPPCGFSPSDERLFDYYEVCSKYNLPVLTHVGPTTPNLSFKHTGPNEIDEAAMRFPKVNFILGHAGTVRFEEAALIAEFRPNVFLDMSGFQTELRRDGFADIMRWHKKRGLIRKLLFGTDWPIHRFYGSQKKWVEAFDDLRDSDVINQQEYESIMYKNTQGLFDE